MKKIGVVTATRAEYGLLRNVIREINEDEQLELVLIVTGTHLISSYGNTIDEIVEDGFPISEKIDYLSKSTDYFGVCESMGNATVLFADAFKKHGLDMLVVLGDRYELIPICAVAMNARIPIAHISGGETTQGAIDEAVRHCVTKMSYLHFPGCEEYRKRVIQLGEAPERVFNFGDVGVENIRKMELLSKCQLENDLGINLDKPYFSVTFHPTTLDTDSPEAHVKEVFDALGELKQYNYIITKANADVGGSIINEIIDEYVRENDNFYGFSSLGIKRYLSLLKYSSGVIGNSSSGIVEAPALKIPTINIGDRQKGRLRGDSIIDCELNKKSIVKAIISSQSKEHKEKCNNCQCVYGEGDTAQLIKETIKDFVCNDKINLQKKFYDVEFEY